MAETKTAIREISMDGEKYEELHTVCYCSDDVALCGVDVSGMKLIDDPRTSCVVCNDLKFKKCPNCGQ